MPKSLYVVLILLTFFAGIALDELVRYPIKIGYYVWQAQGVSWFHFFASVVSFALYASAAYSVQTARSNGIQACIVALLWSAIYDAAVITLVIQDMEGVRNLYVAGREVRGLSVRPEAADLIFSETGLWTSYGSSVVLMVILVLLIMRNRAWFQRQDHRGS